MTQIFQLFLSPALAALFISVLTTPLVIKLYTHQGWLDDPQKNKHAKVTHQHPVPRGGGIPVFLSILIAGSFFLGLDKHFLGILFGSLFLTIVGTLDDIHNLSPYIRIITTIIAGLFVVAAGIGIAYVTNPFGPPGSIIPFNQPQIAFDFLGKTRTIWVLADIFALLWILWMANIVNWSKGLDGQMSGFVAIAAVFIGLLSFRFVDDITQWQVIQLAAITAGAYAGFTIFNFYPQKIMPGYGGGSLAGFLLAVLAILSGAKLAAMILIIGIPTMDAIYIILRRLSQGKSPVWGDRGHLHHRLLDANWSKPQIALFYWLTTFALGVLALKLNSTQKLFTIITIALTTGGLILWLSSISKTLHKNAKKK